GRDQDAYRLQTFYNHTVTWGNSAAFSPDDKLIDPLLKPSRTNSYEGGANLGLINDRIEIDFTYFNKLDKNWIQSVSIPVTSGHSTLLTNGNEYLRRGYEFKVIIYPIVHQDFRWKITANWYQFENILNHIY